MTSSIAIAVTYATSIRFSVAFHQRASYNTRVHTTSAQLIDLIRKAGNSRSGVNATCVARPPSAHTRTALSTRTSLARYRSHCIAAGVSRERERERAVRCARPLRVASISLSLSLSGAILTALCARRTIGLRVRHNINAFGTVDARVLCFHCQCRQTP